MNALAGYGSSSDSDADAPAAAPPAPKEEPLFGGLGGGLFDKLKAMVEPEDVGGSAPKRQPPKQQEVSRHASRLSVMSC